MTILLAFKRNKNNVENEKKKSPRRQSWLREREKHVFWVRVQEDREVQQWGSTSRYREGTWVTETQWESKEMMKREKGKVMLFWRQNSESRQDEQSITKQALRRAAPRRSSKKKRIIELRLIPPIFLSWFWWISLPEALSPGQVLDWSSWINV